jgi:hypothetical protein
MDYCNADHWTEQYKTSNTQMRKYTNAQIQS